MRIITITQAAFRYGAHTRHKEIVRELLKAGHDVTWVGPSRADTEDMKGVNYLELKKSRISRVPLFGALLTGLLAVKTYEDEFRRADTIFAIGEYEIFSIVSIKSLRSGNIIFIQRADTIEKSQVMHQQSERLAGKFWYYLRGSLSKQLQKFNSRFLTKVIVQTEHHKSRMLEQGLANGLKVEVLPNNSKPSWVGRSAVNGGRETSCASPYVVGFVGNLMYEMKGLDLLVEMFQLLRRSIDCELVVIGGGSGETRLRQKIEELGLQDHCALKGRIDNASNLMGGFDVLFAPTRYDDCPNVILEAMAMGVPVVASRIDAHEFLMGTDSEGLVDFNTRQMAELLEAVLIDEGLRERLIAAQNERVREFDFDWGEAMTVAITG